MLGLPEQLGQNTIALLVKAKHPMFTFETVNQIIADLENLKPVEEPEKKGNEDGKGTTP